MADPTQRPTLHISDKVTEKEINSVLSPVCLDDSVLTRVKAVFMDEVRLGLAANPERKSSLQMENTYIKELADGTEHGSYLALDLGGTNFRVLLTTLDNGKVQNEIVEYYHVPDEVRLAHGENLFDFLAECIDDFLKKFQLHEDHYYLGFTFSFPMVQKGVDVGFLTSWTKSFNCPGVVGKDVVLLLNEALKKKVKTNITVTCVLNDTTGTLVQGSFYDKRCAIGMILGTGHNVCYLEKVSNIKKWQGDHTEKEVIIDIEWGAFGDNGVLDFLKTEWDDNVDQKSLLPKSFTFEKYIAGKYLGDLVREALHTLAEQGLFCPDSESRDCLKVHGSFVTKTVSSIEGDAFRGELTYTKEALTNWGLTNVTDDDARICQYVCGVFSYRSALLVSFLSAILLVRMDRPHSTLAIDGSLFEHHPRFRPLMEHLIAHYAPNKPFSLMLVRDGSGKGAAIVTAVVDRVRKNEENVSH